MVALSFCLSRTLSGLSIVSFPKARKDGSVSAMARGSKEKYVKITMYVYLVFILAAMLLINYKLGSICYVTALVIFGFYYRNSRKYFGGTTGDLAGCFLSLCEVGMAFAVVIGNHLIG